MYSIYEILQTLLTVLFWIIMIQIVLSWLFAFNVINHHNEFVRQLVRGLDTITAPLYRPIRRILADDDDGQPRHAACGGAEAGNGRADTLAQCQRERLAVDHARGHAAPAPISDMKMFGSRIFWRMPMISNTTIGEKSIPPKSGRMRRIGR